MVAIEEAITEIFQENQSVSTNRRQKIAIGSDEYLDIANEQSTKFINFSKKLEALNETLITQLHKDSSTAFGVLPSLKRLYSSLAETRVQLKSGPLAPAMKNAIDIYSGEASQLKETIGDIVRIHVTYKDNTKLQSLFRSL